MHFIWMMVQICDLHCIGRADSLRPMHSDPAKCTKCVHGYWAAKFVSCLTSCLLPAYCLPIACLLPAYCLYVACLLQVLCMSCIYLLLSKRILLWSHIRLSPNWSASLTPPRELRTRTVRQISLVSNSVSDSGAYALSVEHCAELAMLRKPSSCLCLSVSGGLKFNVSPHNFLIK